MSVWLGLVAPAGTSADIVGKLQQEVVRILGLADVKERYAAAGLDPATSTPLEFAAFIRREAERWSKVIKDAGIRIE